MRFKAREPQNRELPKLPTGMTSLRVALKLSMAEAKPDEKVHKRKNPMLHDKAKQEDPTLDEILSGRKRRASFESKDSKGKPSSRVRSGSPADESLTGRSEGSAYYPGENTSIISEDNRKLTALEDHDSIASAKGDDYSIADEGGADRSASRNDNEGESGAADAGTTAASAEADVKAENADAADADADADADAENDEREDATSPRSNKKRRKRTSSILRSLEPITGEEVPAAANDEDTSGAPRYQSSRAAAMVAKTKISAKGVGGRTASTDDLAGGGEQTPGAPSRRRKNNAAAAAGPQLNWVQCDRCTKWRSVAAHVDNNNLPEQWFCEMNSWDAHLNNCDAPEEVEPVEPAPAPVRSRGARGGEEGDGEAGEGQGRGNQQRVWVRGGGGGRGRWRRAAAEGEDGEGDGDDNGDEQGADGYGEDQPAGVASRRRSSQNASGGSPRPGALPRGSSGGAAAGAAPVGEVSAVNWVQCNKCRKWRKVPETIDVEALPDRWLCSLNTWNPAVARCSAKQEPDDVAASTSESAATTNAAGGKNPNRARRAQSGGAGNANASAVFGAPGTVKQVSWVQCERRNCKKWRKVPAHIDMSGFPEKWYCEMNTWDGDSATCDAPEASDSENEQPNSAASRQQLILGNSKSANALSYRRIIFGTDGRIRVCFSDKNKNGYGIFSYSETHKPSNDADDYTAPTRRVGYWWSGAYDESAGVAASQNAIAGGKNSKKAAAAALAESAEVSANVKLVERTEPPAPTYLLDTARRLAGMTSKPPVFAWPKKVCKSWTILSTMPLFRRQNLECTVVMSCFMSASTSQLLFAKLLSLVGTCRFSDPEVEACRVYMNSEVLKATVKRLEDKGLVEVSYASAGQLSVEVLPSIAQLTQNLSTRGALSAAAATGISPAWTKQGLPLKLRKFHADSKYKAGVPAVAVVKPAVKEAGPKTGDARPQEDTAGASSSGAPAAATASAALPKHFRLQHREKWAAMAGSV